MGWLCFELPSHRRTAVRQIYPTMQRPFSFNLLFIGLFQQILTVPIQTPFFGIVIFESMNKYPIYTIVSVLFSNNS
jgi:hypothetical protein